MAFKRNLRVLYAILATFNLAAWGAAIACFHRSPFLLGTAFLAYSLGLRHAVDADHIAAIDNTTRKLMQEGKRPVSIGLMFSLGHSTIVIVGSLLIAETAAAMQHRVASVRTFASLIGTTVSIAFLFFIAAANASSLGSSWRSFRRLKRGESCQKNDLDLLVAGRGLLSRMILPAFRLIRTSWHMYPLGILFGLGFDTATEVGLLNISATSSSQGLSLWSVLLFPILFAAAMSTVDSADNILMLNVYDWALDNPMRRIYYNIIITAMSVVAAVGIGGIEVLGLAREHLNLTGRLWNTVAMLNNNLGLVGLLLIGIFAAAWGLSVIVTRTGLIPEPEREI